MTAKSASNRHRLSWLLASVAWVTVAVAGYMGFYSTVYSSVVKEVSDELKHLVDGNITQLDRIAGQLSITTKMVSDSPLTLSFLAAVKTADADQIARTQRELETSLISTLEWARPVRNISLISVDTGRELVRVEMQTGWPVAVGAGSHVDYSAQAFFSAAAPLTQNSIYMEFDPGRGQNDAMISVATPVFDAQGEKAALMFYQFNANLITEFRGSESYLPYGRFVINSDRDEIIAVSGDHASAFAAEVLPVDWSNLYHSSAAASGVRAESVVRYHGPSGDIYAVFRPFSFTEAKNSPRFELGYSITEQNLEALVDEHLEGMLWAAAAVYLLMTIAVVLAWRRGRVDAAEEIVVEFEEVIRRAVFGIVITDERGVIVMCNRAAKELLQTVRPGTSEDAEPQSVFDSLGSPVAGDFSPGMLHSLAPGIISERLRFVFSSDASSRHVELSAIRIKRSEGSDRFAIFVNDVSHQVELTEQVKSANADLEEQVKVRTRELERTRNLAMSANDIKTQFISNISHELRTPLQGIFGMLRLLRQDPLTERQNHRLMLAEESMTELNELINAILDVAKLEADKLDVDSSEISVPTLIHDVAHRYVQRAQQKNLELIVDASDVTSRLVMGDPGRLGRVFSNLIDNAIKFTKRGHVVISARTQQKGDEEVLLEVAVSDTGQGISKANLSKLFETFAKIRVEGEVDELHSGMGLGLSMVKQLCDLMGGEVSVSSELGKGSVFIVSIRLPYLNLNESEPTGVAAQMVGRTVVMVDRSPVRLDALQRLIVRKGGARSLVANEFSELSPDQLKQVHYLLVELSVFQDNETAILEWVESSDNQGEPPKLMIYGPLSAEILTLESKLHNRIFLLKSPVTLISLEESLLRIAGLVDQLEGMPNDLSEEQRHKLWNVIPHLSVLVVDDNLINQKVVGGMLEEYGVSVKYASDGQDAINLMKKTTDDTFDLIIMDCQMPVMDGYEATERIRGGFAGAQYISIPIIAVTAGAMGGDRLRCLESGMTDYLTKPVQPFEIEKKIISLNLDKPIPTAAVSAADTSGDGVDQGYANEVRTMLNRKATWDRDDLNRRLMNKTEIINTVVEIYLKSAPELIKRIGLAAEQEDFKDLRAAAHDLKGISENLAAKKVAYLAYELELSAVDRRLDHINFLSVQLQANFKHLIESLDTEPRHAE